MQADEAPLIFARTQRPRRARHSLPSPAGRIPERSQRGARGARGIGVAVFSRGTGLRSLGCGVAYTLASPDLARLRSMLAQRWTIALTAQDRQASRPHVTVQNKVHPAEARTLLARLSAEFAPFEIEATGLLLWRYRGGPLDKAADFPFTNPRQTGENRRSRWIAKGVMTDKSSV